jgi:phosphate transport system substrate-binding protein
MMTRHGTAIALALVAPLALGAAGASSASASPLGTGAAKVPSAYESSKAVSLDGAGANSIDPFFAKAFYDYHAAHPTVSINYSPAGSSVGVTDIQQGTVNFGDTEIPMSAKDLAKAKGTVLQIPVDLGGVAISYNVPGSPKGLKLDGPTLARIFDGTITNWDSPVIAAVTGDKRLPNLAIVPVHRADSSGPGWDLDEYLIKTSPVWVAKTGTSVASKTWALTKVGVGEQLNTGVATYISQTPGAVGYVEYGYALQAGFADAALKNGAGNYVAPSKTSIAQAGARATKLSAANFSIINEPGGSYPLANFSWTLIYQKQSDTAKGAALQQLFTYVVTSGQAQAAQLGYAPLPAGVAVLAKATLAKLENSAGKPLVG